MSSGVIWNPLNLNGVVLDNYVTAIAIVNLNDSFQ